MQRIAKGTFVSISPNKVIQYYYHVDRDISISCNLLSEVGAKWQPIYRKWLESKGYSLQSIELDAKPYLCEKVCIS